MILFDHVNFKVSVQFKQTINITPSISIFHPVDFVCGRQHPAFAIQYCLAASVGWL